jgi:predicted amidohydrolase
MSVGRSAVLAQLSPVPGDVGANVARLIEIVGGQRGAQLVVFPELFIGGYLLDRVERIALDAAGPELARVREAAATARTAVIVGFAERVRGGIANSAACIDAQGRIAAIYRKVFLFGAEAQAFVRGDRFVVADLDGEHVAPLICFDVEFPEAARAVTRAGARLLVTVSANMEPYYGDHELHSRARALENRLQHLYVNRVGSESGFDFVGGTRSVGPTGAKLLEGGRDEQVLTAELVEVAGFDEHVDYPRFLDALPTVAVELAEPSQSQRQEVDLVAGDG